MKKEITEQKRLGRAFKSARKALKLNRVELGQYLGISKREVFKYEIGKITIPEKHLIFLFLYGLEKLKK